MDPKLGGLDPKLKEAYERVMNRPSAPSGQSTLGSAPIPTPQQTMPAQPATPQANSDQPVLGQAPSTAPSPALSDFSQAPSATTSTVAFNADNSSLNQGAVLKKGGSKTSTLVILIGLIILLVAYTFVWIYIFKLKIPFLP